MGTRLSPYAKPTKNRYRYLSRDFKIYHCKGRLSAMYPDLAISLVLTTFGKKFDSVHQTVFHQKVHMAGYKTNHPGQLFVSSMEITVPLVPSFEANSKYLEGRSAAISAICCKASLHPTTFSIPLARASPTCFFALILQYLQCRLCL